MATAGPASATRGPIWAVACAVVACALAAQAAVIAARTRRRLPAWADALAIGALITIGKWVGAPGQSQYARYRLFGRRAILIEYRAPARAGADLFL